MHKVATDPVEEVLGLPFALEVASLLWPAGVLAPARTYVPSGLLSMLGTVSPHPRYESRLSPQLVLGSSVSPQNLRTEWRISDTSGKQR